MTADTYTGLRDRVKRARRLPDDGGWSDPPTHLPAAMAATRLGISEHALQEWVRQGLLHPVRGWGGTAIYRTATLDALRDSAEMPL